MPAPLGADVIAQAARRYGRELRALLPDTKVALTGSASCDDLPANDVDFVVLVADVDAVAARLRGRLTPLHEAEWREDWVAFRDVGPPQVDVVVTRRGTHGDAYHRRAWDVLRHDTSLRAEYRALKSSCARYEERKAAFFDRVVSHLPAEGG